MSNRGGGSYPCGVCGEMTGVLDSRPVKNRQLGMHTTYRRRKCPNGHRFTTYEVPKRYIDHLEHFESLLKHFEIFQENIKDRND